MSRLGYFVRRTVTTAILIFLAASGLFLLFRFMPGDYTVMLAQDVGQEGLQALEEKWGLNDPLYIQYFNYVKNLLTGDMGTSFKYGNEVTALTLPAIFNSFILVAPAITMSYLLGSVYGGALGMNRDTSMERGGVILSTVFGTLPEFFLGVLLIMVFSQWLGWFPAQGMLSLTTYQRLGENPGAFAKFFEIDFWLHYVLPFTTIMLRHSMFPALVMRTGVVETAGQDFMYLHRIKGLSNWTQLRRIMKHASLPVITLYPASMTRALGGMVVVEIVFNWPGIGSLLVDAVLARDFPVVQFVFFLVAAWVILGNYVIDLLYSVIDPRVTVEGEGGG